MKKTIKKNKHKKYALRSLAFLGFMIMPSVLFSEKTVTFHVAEPAIIFATPRDNYRAPDPCTLPYVQCAGEAPQSVEQKIAHYFPEETKKATAVFQCESGLNAAKESETDTTKDGYPFSHGLAQINISVTKLGDLNCPAAFAGKNYKAVVADKALYDKCVAAAQNADINLQAARKKYDGGRWSAWVICDDKTSK